MKPMLARFERGDEDDRHIFARRILTDAAADLEAVQARHHHVEEDEIDAHLQLGEPFDAVTRRLNLVPQTFDEHLRNLANAIIVVYDEDALGRRKGSGAFFGRLGRRKGPTRFFARLLGPAYQRLANRFDAGFDFCEDRLELLERSAARFFDELAARARDGIGADDRDAALQ